MNLTDAIAFIQEYEPLFVAHGYHLGLTGSVLFKGQSPKDLDLIVYPHNTLADHPLGHKELLIQIFPNIFFKPKGTPSWTPDKDIYVTRIDARRIDFFFLS